LQYKTPVFCDGSCVEELDFFGALGIEYIHPSSRQQPAIMSTGQLGEPPTPTGLTGNYKVTSYQALTNTSRPTKTPTSQTPPDPEGPSQ
jgi:hypothetical protein